MEHLEAMESPPRGSTLIGTATEADYNKSHWTDNP